MGTEAAAAPVIVEAAGLVKTYGLGGPNPVEVLHGIDMEAREGEFIAIIGQSGSGKSTLLNILGALDTPTDGVVRIDGVDIATLDSDGLADLRGRKVGFIFQFHYLLEEFTCLENALMPITIQKGAPEREDIEYAKMLLKRVGLESQMHKRVTQMSGGQQQRNAIVRALVNRPRVVLADEPTGNLDSRSGQEVFALMREIARETGVAFLMVTHDDRLAQEADRILRIEDGLIQEVPRSAAAAAVGAARGR
jgi:ABC-type antimicrobial peptide transport system, ATPase component